MKHPALLASFVAAAIALAPAAVQAQTPKRGGTLTFAVSAEPPNYDCHANASFAFIHPVRPHYSTLLKFDTPKYPAIKGDLAESWTMSKDGLTYTFKLRKDVKFHDGTPLTSEDVKATYERIRNPQGGAKSLRKTTYEDVQSIDTPDAHTVVFRLKRQNASMLSNFASPWDCVYSAAKLKQDPKFPERNVLGTGPFTFVEHQAGSHWVGKRFDQYYEKGKPYLDGFRAVFISGAPMVNALAAGQVLIEFRGHSPADRDRLVNALGDKAMVTETPWVCALVVSMNTKKKPFDDARVRRALSLALDRWSGAEALSKVALVRHVGGVLRPGYELAASKQELEKMPGFSRDINASRAEAKRLLKEAGQENLSFTLTNRNVAMPYTPVGVWLIDQWRQLGLNVKHAQLETRLYLAAQQRDNPTYDAALDFNCDFMDEPNLQLQKYLSDDKSPIQYAGHIDRQLDYLFERQSGELDKKQRYATLREFEKRALEQAYVFPTIWWHRIIVQHKELKGWNITPSHYVGQDLADVWLDK
ncbi:MAG: ABC transporter substrate-binding protein [Betaproteobacteria bacterium]|nr:ABC transporter substrate-binding protein [Betaproteobacteria bacterium]